MGQAAVELPEPTEQASVPSSVSADDLLSQLAGEEIDRLLAEAETAAAASEGASGPRAEVSNGGEVAIPTPAPQPLTAVTEAVAPVVAQPPVVSEGVPAPGAEPDAASVLASEGAAGAEATDGPTASDQSDDAPQVEPAQGQLDALFTELTTEATAAGADAGPGESLELHGHFDGVAPQADDTAPSPLDGELSAVLSEGEKRVSDDSSAAASLEAELMASLDPANASQPAPKPIAEAATPSPASGNPGLLVAALELLNKPFASLPSDTRELLGKVAIVTAFNAVVILVYVVLFRG